MSTERRLRWAVFIIDLGAVGSVEIKGHEQGGERRCLVVSYEPFHALGRVSICPITAQRTKPRYPGEVALPEGEAGQTADAIILCHQVRTVSVLRIKRDSGVIGYLMNPMIRTEVRFALAQHMGLDVDAGSDGASGTSSFV